MNKLFILPIILVAMIGTPLIFAQEDSIVDEPLVEEIVAIGISNAGMGGAAGFIMSILAVAGKRLKFVAKEPIKLRLLLITVAISGAVGYFAGTAGVTAEVTIPATIGITYVVNQTIRPLLAKWAL
jgi:hypothetical protein